MVERADGKGSRYNPHLRLVERKEKKGRKERCLEAELGGDETSIRCFQD